MEHDLRLETGILLAGHALSACLLLNIELALRAVHLMSVHSRAHEYGNVRLHSRFGAHDGAIRVGANGAFGSCAHKIAALLL
jgi:hypothetical protein